MKRFKFSRVFIPILSILALCVVMSLAVIAATSDPAVIFNGRTEEFEFVNALPFGSNTEPDLFVNMKDMMPGDSVTQEITVGTRNIGSDTVRMYLRSENPNEDYTTLLETYGKWVDFTVKNGRATITGNLERGVMLGSFRNDQKNTLTVSLSIDPEAGNEIENLIAEIDWIFTAEVIPDSELPPYIPKPDLPEYDEDTDETVDTEISNLNWLTNDHINYIIGYTDGLVHPEASITRAEVATIFYRLLKDEVREALWSTESIYPDVTEDDWYYMAICTLTNGQILEGYPDGSFRPDEPITRAELAAIISRFDSMFGTLEITESFDDAAGHWAEEYIEFSAARKYVIGYPDGTFRPDRDITRAETVTMVNRCLHRAVDEEGLIGNYITWPDNPVSEWYYYEIIEAANYHDYERSDRDVAEQIYHYENWLLLHEPIDWAWVERNWVLIYTGE